jgi:hypothetical protein
MIADILEVVLFPLLYIYRTFTFQVNGTMGVVSAALTVILGVVMGVMSLDGQPVLIIAVFAYLSGVIQFREVQQIGLGRGSVNELIANTTSLIIFLCILVLIF